VIEEKKSGATRSCSKKIPQMRKIVDLRWALPTGIDAKKFKWGKESRLFAEGTTL